MRRLFVPLMGQKRVSNSGIIMYRDTVVKYRYMVVGHHDCRMLHVPHSFYVNLKSLKDIGEVRVARSSLSLQFPGADPGFWFRDRPRYMCQMALTLILPRNDLSLICLLVLLTISIYISTRATPRPCLLITTFRLFVVKTSGL